MSNRRVHRRRLFPGDTIPSGSQVLYAETESIHGPIYVWLVSAQPPKQLDVTEGGTSQ